MKELPAKNTQIFNFNSNEIRTITIDGEPWFVAKDVCSVLEADNVSKALSRLDDDEKADITLSDVRSGQGRKALIINESGLYSLILSSRKPQAKPFKKWVTSEILPAIHKTGSYSLNAPKTAAHEVQNSIAELAMKTLNLSESGKIEVLQRLCASNGVDASFLPKYSESEDNRPLFSNAHLS